MPARTLGPKEGVGCDVPHWLGRRGQTQDSVPARTLDPKGGVDCDVPHSLGEENKTRL